MKETNSIPCHTTYTCERCDMQKTFPDYEKQSIAKFKETHRTCRAFIDQTAKYRKGILQ